MTDLLRLIVPGAGDVAAASVPGADTGSSGASLAPSAGFTVHRDQAPALRAKFQDALAELQTAKEKIGQLALMKPPVEEVASIEFAEKLGGTTRDEAGSAARAIDSAIRALPGRGRPDRPGAR
nr:hypothetical protein GCM10020241_25940 [Streptoalloteichus tenebrarius]